MFQIRRMCFSNRLTIYKVIIKVWDTVVIKNWYEQLQHSKTFMFHTVLQQGFKVMPRNIIFIL